MGCQSRDYTISDGFLPIYYLGQSITSGICDIRNNFKSLVGGKKKPKTLKRVSNKKGRKYKQYTNGKGNHGKSRKKYIV